MIVKDAVFLLLSFIRGLAAADLLVRCGFLEKSEALPNSGIKLATWF